MFDAARAPRTPFPVPALETAHCGFLTVPENRSVPRGRTIRLAAAILPAPNRAPDPALYLSGRPGEDPLLGADTFVETGLTEDRDLILMSQRATYSSEPRLSCPRSTVCARGW
jgi:hypothetical protein